MSGMAAPGMEVIRMSHLQMMSPLFGEMALDNRKRAVSSIREI